MDSLFLLVPIVIFFVICAVKLFFWAVNSGQYDDLETEGRRILFDDDEPSTQPGPAPDAPDEVRAAEHNSGDKQ